MRPPTPGFRSTTARALQWAALGLVLGVALYARGMDLGTHFTHADDIGVANTLLRTQREAEAWARDPQQAPQWVWNSAEPQLGRLYHQWLTPHLAHLLPALTVPLGWTYAPLQFFLTSPLLSPQLTYREVLFRGRLPSLLFAVLTLLLLTPLWRRLEPDAPFASGLLLLALVGCSWEFVVYSKQMESYAIGCFSAVAMGLGLVHAAARPDLRRRRRLLLALGLAVLASTQYQCLFMAPAFLAALLLSYHSRRVAPLRQVAMALGQSGAAFALLVLPMVAMFLIRRPVVATNWNVGPEREFLFTLPAGAGIAEALGYFATFFVGNTFAVVQSNFAFVPAESPILLPFAATATALMLLGLVALARAGSPAKRALFGFFALFALTWLALVLRGLVTLSPTRHSLILLPFMAILLVQGVLWASERLAGRHARQVASAASAGLTALVVAGFLSCLPEVRRERADPFDPTEIRAVLQRWHATTVLTYRYTENVQAMVNDLPGIEIGALSQITPEAVTAAFAARRTAALGLIGHMQPLPAATLGSFRVLYRRELASNVEIEFLPRTHNGSNGLYFYVVGRRGDATPWR